MISVRYSLTSRFENRSLSMKSDTPISWTVVSAKATPTDLNFALEDNAAAAVANFMAITIGEELKSELVKSRSSTDCKLPGDA